MSYNETTYQEVLQRAQYLAESTTEEQFFSRLREYYQNQFGLSEADADAAMESVKKVGDSYVGDQAGAFLFNEKTQVGDTVLIDMPSYSSFDIYMLTKKPYLNESKTKNVRHILVTEDIYESSEAALKKTQDIFEQWENGEATNNSFGLLALAYSEDAGSCFNGGLYENIKKGQMVEQFEAWCFDNSRKTGDTGIVQTDYGYHIMYFEGDGDIAWRAQIKDNIISAEYNEICDALIENTAVTYNEDVIYNIQVKA